MNKTSFAICQSHKCWTLLIFIRILEIGALTGFMYVAIMIFVNKRSALFSQEFLNKNSDICYGCDRTQLPPYLKGRKRKKLLLQSQILKCTIHIFCKNVL